MKDGRKTPGFSTRAIHGGQSPDPSTGAVMPPIYATSTYAQASPGVHQGYEYSRTHNPTRMAFERCIADLEGGARGFAFASGMATTATLLELVDSGSHVIAMDDLYGGSFRLFERVRRRSAGLDFTFVDLSEPKAAAAAIRPGTRMIWVETPTNPLLKSTSRPWPRRRAVAAYSSSWTTPLRPPGSSARSSSARTSSCTRRPSS
jgi:cystathionine gamma-lyase